MLCERKRTVQFDIKDFILSNQKDRDAVRQEGKDYQWRCEGVR